MIAPNALSFRLRLVLEQLERIAYDLEDTEDETEESPSNNDRPVIIANPVK